MDTRNEVRDIRERFNDEGGLSARGPERGEWLKSLGTVAAALAVAVALGVILASCGKSSDQTAQSQADHAVQTSGAGSQNQVAAAVPQGGAPRAQGGLSAADVAVREGLPPDLEVAVSDTLVLPGQAVGVTVEGTPDVAEVALSDGRDTPMPLVRTAGTDTWQVQYRVPLHPRHERFGLSVTAKNDANRWRRTWVFLHVAARDTTAPVTAPADSSGEKGECE